MSKHHPHCPALLSHQERTTKKAKTVSKSQTFFITDQKHNHQGFLWNSFSILPNSHQLLTLGSEGSFSLWDISKAYSFIKSETVFKKMPILSSTYIPSLNKIAFTSNEYQPLKLIDLKRGKLEEPKLKKMNKNYFSFNKVLYVEDRNYLVAGGYDKELVFFDANSLDIIHSIPLGCCIGNIYYLKSRRILIISCWS